MKLRLPLLVATAFLALACKSGGIPDNAKTTVLSFPDLDCADCGEEMARKLIDSDGVYKTGFNKRKAELTVIAEPDLDVMGLAQKNKPADESGIWSSAPARVPTCPGTSHPRRRTW